LFLHGRIKACSDHLFVIVDGTQKTRQLIGDGFGIVGSRVLGQSPRPSVHANSATFVLCHEQEGHRQLRVHETRDTTSPFGSDVIQI